MGYEYSKSICRNIVYDNGRSEYNHTIHNYHGNREESGDKVTQTTEAQCAGVMETHSIRKHKIQQISKNITLTN